MITQPTHTEQAHAVFSAMKSRGLQINRQRHLVIQALCDHGRWITAEQLWLGIRVSDKISVAAVYNCLNALVRAGVAHKRPLGGRLSYFSLETAPGCR